MKHVIRCLGFANGADCPHEGQFVSLFDHEAYDGRGYAEFTPDANLAMKFESAGAASEFWKKQSATRPLRPDGEPNRPMSGMHAEIVKV